MNALNDFLTARAIWARLTKAQRKALLHPWGIPHPTVEANLRRWALWDDEGVTRSGAVIALIEFQSRDAEARRRKRASP